MNLDTMKVLADSGYSASVIADTAVAIHDQQLSDKFDALDPAEREDILRKNRTMAELERGLAHDRSWSIIPKVWPIKKRMAVLKYMTRCLETMDVVSLKALTRGHLTELIIETGQGYDDHTTKVLKKYSRKG